MTGKSEKHMMGINEVSKMLGISPDRVRRNAAQGTWPCKIKIVYVKRYLFDPDDILEIKRHNLIPDLRKAKRCTMLNYETCKRLKEAGYPQVSRDAWYKVGREEPVFMWMMQRAMPRPGCPNSAIHFMIPSLDELLGEIEKIDSQLYWSLLFSKRHIGYCYRAEVYTSLNYICCDGATREEAAAELWLKLKEAQHE